MSAIITDSVISRTSADGVSPLSSSALRTSSTIVSDWSCFTDRLTLIVSGSGRANSSWRWTACRQACCRTQRPSGMIMPVSSASGMNWSGAEFEPLEDALVHGGLEDPVAALAVPLGHVHGDVGIPEELLGVVRRDLAVGEADPEARPREDLLRVDLELRLERLEDPVGDVRRLLEVSDPVEEDRELVAAEARDGIGGPHGADEALRDLLEDDVARRVAEAVVDGLEVVEVDEHDADGGRASLGAHERLLDAVGEEGAVGEIRHRVVEGLMGELLLEGLALADVAAVQDDPVHVLVAQEIRVLHLELEPGPVAVPKQALQRVRLRPLAADVRHDLREPRPVGLAHEAVEARPLDLVGRVAEHALDRRALVGHDAVGVEDGDQVARVRDERTEARLALPAVEILGEHRALDAPRHLRRKRLQRVDLPSAGGLGRAQREHAAQLVA